MPDPTPIRPGQPDSDGPTWGQFSECHGLIRHAWHIVPSDWVATLGGEQMTVRCERCGTERRDTIGSNTGELVTRRYVYPDGYLYGRDDYKPNADEVRLMWITRQINAQRKPAPRRRGRSA